MSSLHLLTCQQGLSFTLDLDLVAQTPLRINLGQFQVRMEVKMTRSSGSRVVVLFDEPNGRAVVDRTAGTVKFSLTATETQALPVGKYYYEILLSTPFSVEGQTVTEGFRIIEGKFDID